MKSLDGGGSDGVWAVAVEEGSCFRNSLDVDSGLVTNEEVLFDL